MKKILSLFFIVLILNIAPLECMQQGRSGLSRKESRQARQVAQKQMNFLRKPSHRESRRGSCDQGITGKRALLCLFMASLLMTQPQGVVALSNAGQQASDTSGPAHRETVALQALLKNAAISFSRPAPIQFGLREVERISADHASSTAKKSFFEREFTCEMTPMFRCQPTKPLLDGTLQACADGLDSFVHDFNEFAQRNPVAAQTATEGALLTIKTMYGAIAGGVTTKTVAGVGVGAAIGGGKGVVDEALGSIVEEFAGDKIRDAAEYGSKHIAPLLMHLDGKLTEESARKMGSLFGGAFLTSSQFLKFMRSFPDVLFVRSVALPPKFTAFSPNVAKMLAHETPQVAAGSFYRQIPAGGDDLGSQSTYISGFEETAYAPYMQHASEIFQSSNVQETLRNIGDQSSQYTHLLDIYDNQRKTRHGFEGTAYAPYMNNAGQHFR